MKPAGALSREPVSEEDPRLARDVEPGNTTRA